jgi:ParB family chromosome partitioning protein
MNNPFEQIIKTGSKILYIQISRIKPNTNQPRCEFNKDALNELADSISQNGILQPLTVRRIGNNEFELISGERRLRASKIAGLTQVPCIAIAASDEKSAMLALLENLQRQDLSFFEQAQAISKLISIFNLRQEDIATKLGKNQSTIANKIRLLKLTPSQQEEIIKAGLTERHARALLRIEDENRRDAALKAIILRELNVAQAEHYIERIIVELQKDIHKAKRLSLIKDIRLFLNTVDHAVNTMREAGIFVESNRQTQDEFIEYTIRIPTTNTVNKAQAG